MNVNKHSKVRAVGLSSCLALVALLGLAVFCPAPDGANAAVSDNKTFTVNFNVLKLAKEERTADFYVNFLVSQKISIAMSGLDGATATVQPTTDGKTISAYDDFAVSTNSPQGLSVYVYSPDSTTALAGTQSGNSIPAMTGTAASLSGLGKNTWGYNLSLAASAGNAESLQYKGLTASPVASAPDYKTTADLSSAGATNLRLTFGAKVDTATAADTYTKAVKVQAVASGNAVALVNATNASLDALSLDGDNTTETEDAPESESVTE